MLNLPTNNIYAFITVLGIVIAGSSFGLWFQSAKEIETHTEIFGTETKEFNALVYTYITKANEAIKLIREAGSYESLSKEDKQKVDSIYEKLEPLEKRAKELQVQEEIPFFVYTKRIERFELIKILSATGFIIGLVLSVVGFLMWCKAVRVPPENDDKRRLTRHSTRRRKPRGAG